MRPKGGQKVSLSTFWSRFRQLFPELSLVVRSFRGDEGVWVKFKKIKKFGDEGVGVLGAHFGVLGRGECGRKVDKKSLCPCFGHVLVSSF